ncbi:MAG: hypothetical protein ACREFE_10935, partial [Limisphaerales bacterium]
MKVFCRMFISKPLARCAVIFPIVLLLSGCGRDGVKVYRIENDDSAAAAQPSPQLQFILPQNWTKKKPSQMRVASFTVTGANGQTADVGVIPLPIGGSELDLVNMWRGQMQLP